MRPRRGVDGLKGETRVVSVIYKTDEAMGFTYRTFDRVSPGNFKPSLIHIYNIRLELKGVTRSIILT